ncbi:MAG: type II secretion system minor pseudopilin GspI [Burkholderiaceae bacterium]
MRSGGGFTLVEVLVALIIVSLVLATSLRAAGVLATGQDQLEHTALAGWSAENALAETRLAKVVPPLGKNVFECPELALKLVCEREVRTTPNIAILRIDVRVFGEVEREHVLAKRTAFMSKLP